MDRWLSVVIVGFKACIVLSIDCRFVLRGKGVQFEVCDTVFSGFCVSVKFLFHYFIYLVLKKFLIRCWNIHVV